MLALATSTLGAGHGIHTNVDCDLTAASEIQLKWHPFASEWGLYSVVGDAGTANEKVCEGASPKLHLQKGQKYMFVQNDVSNWYHPVGFSYEPGGAHNDCKIDDSGECPELGGEDGGSTLQYYIDGAPTTADGEFGLDDYEPRFFFPQEAWSEHTYGVELTVPDVTSFYYFCHIHAGMSANIHVVGASTGAPGPKQHDEFFPVPPMITAHDEACGTVGVFDHEDHLRAACDGKHFLCGNGLDDPFNECMQAIDCKMHVDMAVHTDADPVKTFMRQMIPHHQNAVSMSKILMKHAPDADDEVKALLREIMAVQNHQIQAMQAYLGDEGAQHCYNHEHCPPGCKSAHGARALLFGAVHNNCPSGCVAA